MLYFPTWRTSRKLHVYNLFVTSKPRKSFLFSRSFHALSTLFPRSFHALSTLFPRSFHVLSTLFPSCFRPLSAFSPRSFHSLKVMFSKVFSTRIRPSDCVLPWKVKNRIQQERNTFWLVETLLWYECQSQQTINSRNNSFRIMEFYRPRKKTSPNWVLCNFSIFQSKIGFPLELKTAVSQIAPWVHLHDGMATTGRTSAAWILRGGADTEAPGQRVLTTVISGCRSMLAAKRWCTE